MTNTATPVATGHTIDDAADAMAGLVDDLFDLDDSDAAAEDRAIRGEASKEAEGVEDDEAPVETKSEDEAEAETEDEGAEESEQDEETEATTETGEKMVTVQLGSKSFELPESVAKEVEAGIQRNADYTQKTQALAAEKKQFEPEMNAVREERTALRTEREQVKATLEFLAQSMPEPTAELLQVDPVEYIRQKEMKALFDQAVHQNASRLQELSSKEQTQRQAEADKTRAAQVNFGTQKMLEWFPSWKDPKVRSGELESLEKWANENEVSSQELALITDPRILKALVKSSKYDALTSGAKELKPTPRSKTIAASSPQNRVKSTKRSSAQDRLARTGSLDDFAAAVSDMEF